MPEWRKFTRALVHCTKRSIKNQHCQINHWKLLYFLHGISSFPKKHFFKSNNNRSCFIFCSNSAKRLGLFHAQKKLKERKKEQFWKKKFSFPFCKREIFLIYDDFIFYYCQKMAIMFSTQIFFVTKGYLIFLIAFA